MTSSKQVAANRKNALQSGGPTSDAGKATSRLNASTHGLTGEGLVTGENLEEMLEFVEKIVADLDPLGANEEELARDYALCSWRLRRAHKAEAGLQQYWLLIERKERLAREAASRPVITPELAKRLGYKAPPVPSEEERLKWWHEIMHADLGEAISVDSSGPNALLKLARYEAHLSRRRDRALALFLALQRERLGDLPRELSA